MRAYLINLWCGGVSTPLMVIHAPWCGMFVSAYNSGVGKGRPLLCCDWVHSRRVAQRRRRCARLNIDRESGEQWVVAFPSAACGAFAARFLRTLLPSANGKKRLRVYLQHARLSPPCPLVPDGRRTLFNNLNTVPSTFDFQNGKYCPCSHRFSFTS